MLVFYWNKKHSYVSNVPDVCARPKKIPTRFLTLVFAKIWRLQVADDDLVKFSKENENENTVKKTEMNFGSSGNI